MEVLSTHEAIEDIGVHEPRLKLQAFGAARQLLEESRSIFISNLTNPESSFAIAQQFAQKAGADQDGRISRAQLRQFIRGLIAADVYAGLDLDSQVAAVLAYALGTTAEFERQVGRSLDRIGEQSHDDFEDEDGAIFPGPSEFYPEEVVEFSDFRKVVDALSLIALLRADGVREEVPISEDRNETLRTLALDKPYISPWGDITDTRRAELKGNEVCKTWEEAYATGKNCIWVLPDASQEVKRVLAEEWFETQGSCLELGCGLGYDAAAFAEAGFDVIGVDISETAISSARNLAEQKCLQSKLRFVCGDAYELPTPSNAFAFIWDNTLFQNAHRGDRLGPAWKYNSSSYKKLLLRLTAPGSLVLINVMSSELTESHMKLAERGFLLPLVSAMRVSMEFVEFFEFIFFRGGVYDMNSLFIQEALQVGYKKPAILGGLPSWCILMRRRATPKPYVPVLPLEEPFVVAATLLARDGFKKPAQPLFLKRLVVDEWGEKWGDVPCSSLMLIAPEDIDCKNLADDMKACPEICLSQTRGCNERSVRKAPSVEITSKRCIDALANDVLFWEEVN